MTALRGPVLIVEDDADIRESIALVLSDEGVTSMVASNGSEGIDGSKPTIAYCRIGERSSHTWFVLRYLLGYPGVINYDGSWTEWGNLVGAPVERGAAQAAKA